jgi:hypothetical protein
MDQPKNLAQDEIALSHSLLPHKSAHIFSSAGQASAFRRAQYVFDL